MHDTRGFKTLQKENFDFNEHAADHVKGYRYRKNENKTNKRCMNRKLFGYIFRVLTLKFALDSTLESVQKISVMRWEMNSFLD